MKFTAFILSFQMISALSPRSEADIEAYNPSVSQTSVGHFYEYQIKKFRVFWQTICMEIWMISWIESEETQLDHLVDWKGFSKTSWVSFEFRLGCRDLKDLIVRFEQKPFWILR